ncbi:MAG TPA: DUF1648 domain-containing protein [Thermomicrobiaceae bacterium]|nr:DUF1648 domain-containing protein [Thermomicrobiaceae bacterium]
METGATDASTHRWRPAPSPGGLIGALGIIVSALLAAGALFSAVGRSSLPVLAAAAWLAAVALLGLALALGYLLWGYLSIDYELGERELIVRWAHRRDRIELTAVTHMGPATEVLGEHPGGWQRFWPGYYVAVRQAPDGPVRVVATLPPRRQLVVSTAVGHYAISPERPVLFIEEYGRLRRALDVAPAGPAVPEPGQGALRLVAAGWTSQVPIVLPPRPTFDDEPDADGAASAGVQPGTGEPAPAFATGAPATLEARLALLGDPVAVASVAVALAFNLTMIGYILARYGSIPSSIALHWNVNGLPDRIGSPREIWTLPLIAGLVTLTNMGLAWSIVRFDRFAARFLLAAACLVQVVTWVALISLLRR